MRKHLKLTFSLVFFITTCISPGPAYTQTSKKVLMIIAQQNFRDEELTVPQKMFLEKGLDVVIASSSTNVATGMLGARVKPDITLKEVQVDEYAAIVFVGGSGAQEYFNNSIAHTIAREAVKQNKILAAICIAPAILARAGVLKGKTATIWPSMAEAITAGGSRYIRKDVHTDGDIVTASGPRAAPKFAEETLARIKLMAVQ